MRVDIILFCVLYVISFFVGYYIIKKSGVQLYKERFWLLLITLISGIILIWIVYSIRLSTDAWGYICVILILLIQIVSIIAIFFLLDIKGISNWFYIVVLLFSITIYIFTCREESKMVNSYLEGIVSGNDTGISFERTLVYCQIRRVIKCVSVIALDLGYVLQSKKDKSKE